MTTTPKNNNTDDSLKIALLVGQPDNGKSFLGIQLIDFGRLTHQPSVFLGDGEEGTNLVFTRTDPRRIKPFKLESEHEVEDLVTTMEEGNFTHALLDTPGSSQRPIKRACGNFADLTESDVVIVPIIVVGSRDGADRVGNDWLKIVQELPKIYWIWNNQLYGEEDNRALPAHLEKQIPGITKKIVEIRIPPLRDDIAKEISRLGALPSLVAAGMMEESVLLRHRNVKGKVARWMHDAKSALAPLLAEFPSESNKNT